MTNIGKTGSELRWAFMEGFDIGVEGDPYLDRLRIIQTPFASIYLHHIHRADKERDPHDHPWTFWSMVLTGAYKEDVLPDKTDSSNWITRQRSRWSIRHLGIKSAHMITHIDKPLWTLVITGPRRKGWGFWRDGKFVPWREYQYPESRLYK